MTKEKNSLDIHVNDNIRKIIYYHKLEITIMIN